MFKTKTKTKTFIYVLEEPLKLVSRTTSLGFNEFTVNTELIEVVCQCHAADELASDNELKVEINVWLLATALHS